MAPTRQKKRKSTDSNASVEIQSFPAPPQLIPTKVAMTPSSSSRSPIRKSAPSGLTLAQKQALVDNLQLEVTERARKLRAQYMLQAQGLRTRIEIRINRIPMALRRANMGELLLKYSEGAAIKLATTKPRAVPSKNKSPARLVREQHRATPSPQHKKRLSREMTTDKENDSVENPKKRIRGPEPAIRSNIQTNAILSPRSANSQSHLRSPVRPAKSGLARPISPLKPTAPVPAGGAAGILTNMVEMAKSTRTRKAVAAPAPTAVARSRKAAPVPIMDKKEGRGRAASDSSNTSGGTVIRKQQVKEKKAPATKRTVMGTIKAMGATGKKAPGPKAVVPATTGGRVLRKRA